MIVCAARRAFPAAYDGVVGVTAVDHRGRAYRNANQGGYVDIAAPGVNLVSAKAGGGERNVTGTSFATPFVLAALAVAREGGRDPVKALRLVSLDLGAEGRDDVYGWGLTRINSDMCG